MLQPDLLQGHEVLCQLAAPLEDGGIGPLGQRASLVSPGSILLLLSSQLRPLAFLRE